MRKSYLITVIAIIAMSALACKKCETCKYIRVDGNQLTYPEACGKKQIEMTKEKCEEAAQQAGTTCVCSTT